MHFYSIEEYMYTGDTNFSFDLQITGLQFKSLKETPSISIQRCQIVQANIWP